MFLYRFTKLLRCRTSLDQLKMRMVQSDTIQQEVFTNFFDMNATEASQYITINELKSTDTQRLSETIKFFTNNNYDQKELLEHPRLFKSCASVLWEHTYLYFKECGCNNISVKDLLKVRALRKLSITQLKGQGIIPRKTKVAEKLNSIIAPYKVDISDLQDSNLSLLHIHETILHRYLQLRLDAGKEDIEKLIDLQRAIRHKSFKNLSENIDIALGLGFSKQKIIKNGYILYVLARYTKEVLATIPYFVGSDLRKDMISSPKLIGIPLHNYLKIHELLSKSNVNDSMIRRNMNIFTLSPDTVKKRLRIIRSIPETRVLMNNPRILSLVIHYTEGRYRLSFLQELKLKCASLIVIGTTGPYFDNHVKEGKDVNKICEICRYIRTLLKDETAIAETNFRKHPYYLNVPIVNIEDTYIYLKCEYYRNQNIIDAVQILLYPREKIKEAIEYIKSDDTLNANRKLSKTQILNLALYHLEKDHHFTGNGIWDDAEG